MECGQGALRVNRFNPYEGYVGSESAGQDILIAGRVAMNRALDGDIVAVELLPEEQVSLGSILNAQLEGSHTTGYAVDSSIFSSVLCYVRKNDCC